MRLPRLFRRRPKRPAPAVLLTRPDCDLCEELLGQVRRAKLDRRVHLEEVDVDSSPDLKKRFGQRIPVLLVGGEVCAEGRVERAELVRRFTECERAWQARDREVEL